MVVFDVFSKRQKKIRDGGIPEIYEYDDIPTPLRIQIVHILRDLIGERSQQYGDDPCVLICKAIENTLSREYGVFSLAITAKDSDSWDDDRVMNFVLKSQNHEQVLDVIEVGFKYISYLRENDYEWGRRLSKERFEGAIEELNFLFREHSIGFQFESGEIIRVDSKLIHSEVIKPTLILLTAEEYAGANDEFLKAFEHYRKDETKACLAECLKAFESTMKAICNKRN